MRASCILVSLLSMGQTIVFAADPTVSGDRSRPPVEVVEATISAHAIIGFSWIDQPVNKIVLIKTKHDQCAIKYLSFSREPDHRQAKYDDFYGEAELYSQLKRTVLRLHLTEFPLRGSHEFAFGGGRPYFQCGRERILWGYPTATYVRQDTDASLASTQLEDFSQIDFQDPDVQWFKYDESRNMMFE